MKNKVRLFNYRNQLSLKQVELSWLINNASSVKSLSVINTNSRRYPVILTANLKHPCYMKLEIKFMNKQVCNDFVSQLTLVK